MCTSGLLLVTQRVERQTPGGEVARCPRAPRPGSIWSNHSVYRVILRRKGHTGLLYRLSWDKFFLRFPWSLELEMEGVQPRIDKLGSEVVWDFSNFEIKL